MFLYKANSVWNKKSLRRMRLWWILRIYDTPDAEQFIALAKLIDSSLLESFDIQNSHIAKFECVKEDLLKYTLYMDTIIAYVKAKRQFTKLLTSQVSKRSVYEIIDYHNPKRNEILISFRDKCVEFYSLLKEKYDVQDLDAQYNSRLLLHVSEHLNNLVLFILRFE